MSLIIGIGTRIGRRVNGALKKWHTVVSQLQAMFLYRVAGGADNDDLPESNGRAVINAIYGNTVKWNQMIPIPDTDQSIDGSGVTITDNRNGSYTLFTIDTGATATKYIRLINGADTKFIVGHKYFITGITGGTSTTYYLMNNYSASAGIYRCFNPMVFTALKPAIGISIYVVNNAIITTPVTVKPQIIDLTALEYPDIATTTPTVEEVEAWLALNVGTQDYYPYDEGSLIGFKGQGVKSVGFNKWDEQWEIGTYVNGQKYPGNTTLRCANPIKVLPNITYYNRGPKLWVHFLNANGEFISVTTVNANTTFTTLSNAAYIVFRADTNYGTTYNHDICINISDATKNGTYEPYWSDEKPFDVTKVYGKLRGEGSLVQVFPDGMFGADYIEYSYGTIEAAPYYKKIDLGDCAWSLVSGCSHTFETTIDITKAEAIGYTFSDEIDESDTTQDKLIGLVDGGSTKLAVLDRSLSSTDLVDGHIAALEGMDAVYYNRNAGEYYLNLVYRDNGTDTPLEEIFPIKYKVDKYSTEEVLVPAGDAPTSTSMIADMEYQAR